MADTALELIKQAAAKPTYDELLRRDPVDVSREDRRLIVEHLREERALYLAREKEREDKKALKEQEGETVV